MLVNMNCSNVGGDLVPTILWENPNPTSAYTSTADITLSESLDNFEYVGFTYKSTKDTTDKFTTIIPVDVFKQSIEGATLGVRCTLGAIYNSGYYLRILLYRTSTTMSFGGAYKVNSAGQADTMVIPLKVIGYNQVTGGWGGYPNAEAITVVTGTNSYTLLKDYKYITAVTWDTSGTSWTRAGTLNDEYADAEMLQSSLSTMVWYNVKQGDVYKNVVNGTLRLIGFN